jgi:hypothetical protein
VDFEKWIKDKEKSKMWEISRETVINIKIEFNRIV